MIGRPGWGRQRQQMRAFRAPTDSRNRIDRAVSASVGNIVEPAANFLVRRLDIEGQAGGAQLRHQWHIETITKKANEAFDLALSLRSIWLAHLRQVTVVMGKIQERRLEAVKSGAIGVTGQ